MLAEDIQRLQKELGCSTGELATAVGVETKTILAWQSGDAFPTQRHVAKLEALRSAGPGGLPRRARAKPAAGVAVLADPRLWMVVRKMVEHPELLAEVEKLAQRYEDPAEKR